MCTGLGKHLLQTQAGGENAQLHWLALTRLRETASLPEFMFTEMICFRGVQGGSKGSGSGGSSPESLVCFGSPHFALFGGFPFLLPQGRPWCEHEAVSEKLWIALVVEWFVTVYDKCSFAALCQLLFVFQQ